MASLPSLGSKRGIYGLTYGLTWTKGMADLTYQPGDIIGLTVAGLHHVGADDYIRLFLTILALASTKRREFVPDPETVIQVELTSDEVLTELNRRNGVLVLPPSELYELLEHEPPAWSGGRGTNPDGGWRWEITREMRRYHAIHTIDEYVDAVAELTEESARQIGQMIPFSVSNPLHSEGADLFGAPLTEHIFLTPDVPLLGSGIDSELWEYVRPLVEAGRWEQVAREAAAFVETRTHELTGSKREILDLMSELLAPPKHQPAARETAAERNEADGWHLLARGFFMAIRNHVMHNSVGLEEQLQYGLGALGTASLLVRRIRDAVEHASGGPPSTSS
jgi:hypothetical protein